MLGFIVGFCIAAIISCIYFYYENRRTITILKEVEERINNVKLINKINVEITNEWKRRYNSLVCKEIHGVNNE